MGPLEAEQRLTELGFNTAEARFYQPKHGPLFVEKLDKPWRPTRVDELLGEKQEYKIGRSRPKMEERAKEIRKAFWEGDKTLRALGREHGISYVTAFNLVHHLTYWWV